MAPELDPEGRKKLKPRPEIGREFAWRIFECYDNEKAANKGLLDLKPQKNRQSAEVWGTHKRSKPMKEILLSHTVEKEQNYIQSGRKKGGLMTTWGE